MTAARPANCDVLLEFSREHFLRLRLRGERVLEGWEWYRSAGWKQWDVLKLARVTVDLLPDEEGKTLVRHGKAAVWQTQVLTGYRAVDAFAKARRDPLRPEPMDFDDAPVSRASGYGRLTGSQEVEIEDGASHEPEDA